MEIVAWSYENFHGAPYGKINGAKGVCLCDKIIEWIMFVAGTAVNWLGGGLVAMTPWRVQKSKG